MISFLARMFIKDYKNTSSPQVRQAYGMLCGSVGIGLNILLFIGKFFAGILSGSIAITADAVNNLSDAGSSFITLIGFKMAGQRPDSQHPFGHEAVGRKICEDYGHADRDYGNRGGDHSQSDA